MVTTTGETPVNIRRGAAGVANAWLELPNLADNLLGVHLLGVHLPGVHLSGVHLLGVYFSGVRLLVLVVRFAFMIS